MKKLILIALVLMMALMAFADVVIGSGTLTQRQPFGAWFGFERSASLFTAAELNATGTITNLKWYVGTGQTTNIPTKIYITTTTATTLTATTWATITTGLTPVYDATTSFPTAGWQTIDITDFSYTSDNLLVLCETNYTGGGTGTYPVFRYSSATAMHQAWNQDNSAPTGNGTVNANRPNITFVGITTPVAPGVTTLVSPTDAATGVMENATINWNAASGATGYKLYFGTDNPPTNIVNGTDQGNVFTYDPVGNMLPEQTYYWQVVPFNTYGDATGAAVWSFTTRANPTISSFPTTWDFSNTTTPFPPTNWTKHSGVLANPTVLGANPSGSWNGRNWINTTTTPQNVAACINIYGTANGWMISPPIAVPGTGYELKFDLALTDYYNADPITSDAAGTTGTDDVFAVLIGDGTSWTPANVVRQWDNTGSSYVYNAISNTGTSVTLPLSAGTQYIAFYGISTVSNADNDLFVDNIMVRETPEVPIFGYAPTSISYPMAAVNATTGYTNVVVTNNGGGTLNLAAGAISLIGTDASQFGFTTASFPAALTVGQSVNIPVRFNPTSIGTKAATLRISYDGTDYDVALSGAAYSSTALYESFENVTFPPTGWANPGTWSRSTSYYAEGVASAYKFTSTTESILSTPLLTMLGDSSVMFMARTATANADQRIQVKYSPDRTNWTSIGDPIALASNAAFAYYNVDLSSLAGNNYYLGFAALTASAAGSIYMDQVAAPAATPLVPDPVALVSPADAATAQNEKPTLSWTGAATGGIPTGFKVYCDTSNPPTTLITTATASPYTFTTALNYDTLYYWSIVATNANGDAVGSPVRSFTTRTDPTISTFPWLVDFGTTGASFPPTNWINLTGLPGTTLTTGGSWTLDDFCNLATTPVNYSGRLNVWTTTTKSWLVTPPIVIPGDGYELKFDLGLTTFSGINVAPTAGAQADDKFIVYISDNPGMTGATILQEWNNTGSANVYDTISPNGQIVTIPLTGITGTKYFAYYGESTVDGGDNNVYVDNVLIREIPAGAPEAVTLNSPADEATGLSKDGFNLTWTPALTGGTADYYAVYMSMEEGDLYGDVYFETTSTSLNPTTFAGGPSAPVVFEYLDRYFWTVEAVNGSGSAVFEPARWFVIEDAPQVINTFPWVENFDLALTPPTDWTVVNADGAGTSWAGSAAQSHSAPNSFVHNFSTDPAAGQDGWLITPAIAVPTGNYYLSWWNYNVWPTYLVYNGVKVNTTNDPADPNWVELWSPTTVASSWSQAVANISAYAGQTVYFAFNYQGYDGDNWFVDDVSVYELLVDTFGPVITHLPIINTPREDIGQYVVADIVDDPTWNNAIGGANIYYSIDGGTNWSAPIAMTLDEAPTYYAVIPAQALGTTVTYKIEAWDNLNNMTTTINYDYVIADPTWVWYDEGGTTYLGYTTTAFGPTVMFENPFYETGTAMQLLATDGSSYYGNTADLQIYTWDGVGALTPYFVTPIPVTFGAQTYETFDLSSYNVQITTPYYFVSYLNIPMGNYILFDGTYDYGTSYVYQGTTLYTMSNPGSWAIGSYVQTGMGLSLDTPVVSIELSPLGEPSLSWVAVDGANSYLVYGATDPYAADPWTLLGTVATLEYVYTGTDAMHFFKVVANSDAPILRGSTVNMSSRSLGNAVKAPKAIINNIRN